MVRERNQGKRKVQQRRGKKMIYAILGILIAGFRGDFKKVSENENSTSDGNTQVKK